MIIAAYLAFFQFKQFFMMAYWATLALKLSDSNLYIFLTIFMVWF